MDNQECSQLWLPDLILKQSQSILHSHNHNSLTLSLSNILHCSAYIALGVPKASCSHFQLTSADIKIGNNEENGYSMRAGTS